MARARLSIVLPSLAGGGAERAIGAVANGLAARGTDVTLVLGNAEGPFLADVHPGVQVVDLHSTSMLAALPGLVRHLRSARPDVLLAAMSHANVSAALAHRFVGSSARLVLSERVHLSSLFDQCRDLRTRVTGHLMRLTYPWADRVVAVSEGVAKDLTRHVAVRPDRVVAVHNPVVDQQMLDRAAVAPTHPWLMQASVPVVLAAGRLIAQKDFAMLLDAFARLRRQRRVRLLILGEGPLREALHLQALQLGVSDDVDMPGFEANPFAVMRAASVFVLSSRFEGLPGVLIQAMACGTRVVSTDCDSGPREILDDGRWGRLVPVGDAAAMAAALAATLDDPSPPDVRQRAAAFSVEQAVAGYAAALGLP